MEITKKFDRYTTLRILAERGALQHSVATPVDLADEMIALVSKSLTEDAKILVMFNVEFVVSLSEDFPWTKDNIILFTNGDPTLEKLAQKMDIDTIDSLETDMKFYLVLGNPPFDDVSKKNSDKLWPFFVEKAINLTEDGGTVSLVIPDTWTSGTRSLTSSGRKNLLSEVFSEYNLEYLNFDVKKHFPKVGSGFSVFCLRKSAPSGKTLVSTEEGSFAANTVGLKYMPKTLSKLSLSIVEKVTNHDYESVYFKFYSGTEGVTLEDKKSARHSYEYVNTSSNHPNKFGDIAGRGFGEKKVVYAYMGSKQKFTYDMSGKMSVMHNARAYVVDKSATKKGLKSFFESKLVSFLNKDKWSQYNEPKILNMLPAVDFSEEWTDEEIYDYFGLTNEEIEYVEANI